MTAYGPISRKQLEMLFIATIANRFSAVRQYGRLSYSDSLASCLVAGCFAPCSQVIGWEDRLQNGL